jgi:hypothetical protein
LPTAARNQLATASAPGTPGTRLDAFWNPVAVTPNTTYFLVFTGDPTLGIAGDVNPYSRGQAYANAGFQPLPLFDYTFRTYYDNAFAGVPDHGPAALLLLISLTTLWVTGRVLQKSVRNR